MKHKCDCCEHRSVYDDGKFRPVGVCLKENNLIEAERAYNAMICPYKKTSCADEQDYKKGYQQGVKDFAERMKAEMDNLSRMDYHCEPYFLVSKSFIDQIAKETGCVE